MGQFQIHIGTFIQYLNRIMESEYDLEFKKIDFTKGIEKAMEYDQCTFLQCNFSEVNLSSRRFIDCDFIECNLSGATVDQTAFQNCQFKECKMLGVNFQNTNPFLLQVQFEGCQLSHSIFYKLSLKNTSFTGCELSHCDFSEAKLQNSNFNFSTFNRTLFDQTHLENSDVRETNGFYLDITNNFVTGLKIDKDSALGLLQKFNLKVE